MRFQYAPLGEFAGAKPEDFTIITNTPQPPALTPEPETGTPVTAAEVPTAAPETGQPNETAQSTTPEQFQSSPSEPPPIVENPPTAPVPSPQTSAPTKKAWEEVLKEDGFDDFDIKLLKHRKTTGDYKAYMQAHSVDYSNMPAHEIMRRDLRERYPNMSTENFDRYYHQQVTAKYNLGELADPEEQALGKELLEQDAAAVRDKFVQRQSEFALPERDVNAEHQAREEQQRQANEAFAQQLLTSNVTQALTANKKLVIDTGEQKPFNFEVANPGELTELVLNPAKYAEIMSTRDAAGNVMPDFQKTMLLAAVANNPLGFVKALINHGKSLGREQIAEQLENPSTATGQPAAPQTETMGQAWVNRGSRNW